MSEAARWRGGLAAAVTAIALVACGGDSGAGAGGTAGGAQSPPAGGTTSATAVTVSGALPTTGNGAVAGSAGVSSTLDAGTRRMIADGASGTVQHRFTIDYDPVSGVVLGVAHGWGASLSALEAATACVRAVTVVGQVACGSAVTLDQALNRVTFTGAVLRGSGTFTSILTGTITYTVR